ncbi:MAG: hypothetical protein ABW120_05000 [Sedimenticola sp.]
MERNNLTRQQASDIVDVSMVTVHKWLSGGDIKTQHAQLMAEKIWCDWLWIKYGEYRIPEELERCIMSQLNESSVWQPIRETSAPNRCFLERNEAVVINAGNNAVHTLNRTSDQMIGRNLRDFMPSDEGMIYTQRIIAAAHIGVRQTWSAKYAGALELNDTPTQNTKANGYVPLCWVSRDGTPFFLVSDCESVTPSAQA